MRCLLREQLIQAYKTKGGFSMTEQLLRNCVKEAQEKGQIGLFIWVSWKIWDEHGSEMTEDNELYDLALLQIKRGEAATIDFVMGGFHGVGIFAVSLEKLNSSEWYFREFLKTCEMRKMEGPITLIPSNKVSDHC